MASHHDVRSLRGRWTVVLCTTIAWLGLMVGFAEYLVAAEGNAEHSMTARLQARIATGAEFASLYVGDILARERAQAGTWLRGASTSHRSMALATGALGAHQAILLNSVGDVLRVLPDERDLLGVDIAPEYADLTAALAGQNAVSNVVAAEVGMTSAVALTIPFHSHAGRRVFSVTFAASRTPLEAYVNHLLTVPGNHVYVVDSVENLVASSGARTVTSNLAGEDRQLATLLTHETAGHYGSRQGEQVLVSARIAGTPWRLVATEPAVELYSSVDGTNHSLAWVALAGLALAGLVIIAIGARLARDRSRLAQLASQLDRLARVDALTDLSNRRHVDEILDAALSAARRRGSTLSVLVIDIDHFKQINDRLGHEAGDAVLTETARAMRTCLRAEESVGRWGGEEFVAVLPDTDAEQARLVAERVRSCISQTVSSSDQSPVTVTIGVAAFESETKSELLYRADAALYAGKRAGRNQVQVAPTLRADALANAG